MRGLAMALILSLVSAIPSSAQIIIGAPGGATAPDTGPNGNWPTIGQTFTAPGDVFLEQFSFWFSHEEATPYNFTAQAMLYAWDPTGGDWDPGVAVGDVLWETEVSFIGDGVTPFTRLDLYPGGVPLGSGGMYVMLLTTDFADRTDWDYDAGPIRWEMADVAIPGSGYLYGDARVTCGAWDYDFRLATADWETGAPYDFRFEAQMSPVPEPSTVILLGSGLLGLGIFAWRRKEED